MKKLIQMLTLGIVVALGDVHTNNNARVLTAQLLKTGKVKILFIEWPDVAGLNQVIGKLIGERADQETALQVLKKGNHFAGLSMTDASPSLIELTALAISLGIRVAACDLDKNETLQRITAFRQIEEYPAPKISVLFDDEGLAVRDDYAATQIGRWLGKYRTGRLVLWGDNHFRDYDNRYLKPRHHLIKKPAERFDVLKNNLLKKIRSTHFVLECSYVPNAHIKNYAR